MKAQVEFFFQPAKFVAFQSRFQNEAMEVNFVAK